MQGKLFTPDTIAALAQIGRDPDEAAVAAGKRSGEVRRARKLLAMPHRSEST